MKTVNFFKKRYRTLTGSKQNDVIGALELILFNEFGQETIADALWDSNPNVWCTNQVNDVKFESKSLANFLLLVSSYKTATNGN